MRSSLVAVLLLCACGGNYSNADVEFAASVPRRADVTTNLSTANGTSGLRAEGLASSTAGLGEASAGYQDTTKASEFVDGVANFFISILEFAERYDPTVRTPDFRMWGPWDHEKPGWELRLIITKQPVLIAGGSGDPVAGFVWQIQYRDVTETDFRATPLVEGLFEPGDIRRGRGWVVAYFREYRDSGMATQASLDELGALAHMELGYDTRVGQPHSVALNLTDDVANAASLSYVALDSGAGQLSFSLEEPPPSTNRLQVTSRWQNDKAGRSDAVVTSGTATGQIGTECWDSGHSVVYLLKPWEAVQDGSESACAFGAP